MKIIGHSNFDLETVAEFLIAENVPPLYAQTICDAVNNKFSGDDALYFYHVKPDDYKLWRGMEDLV